MLYLQIPQNISHAFNIDKTSCYFGGHSFQMFYKKIMTGFISKSENTKNSEKWTPRSQDMITATLGPWRLNLRQLDHFSTCNLGWHQQQKSKFCITVILRGKPWWLMVSSNKGPVMRVTFPCHDVITCNVSTHRVAVETRQNTCRWTAYRKHISILRASSTNITLAKPASIIGHG